MTEIRWETDRSHQYPAFRGWRAFIGEKQVGKVYVDGTAWFGTEQIRCGSQAIAAEALVRYWSNREVGGEL